MPGVALERIASLRAETGAVPRQLEHPAVLPSGRIFAIRMPDRKLVSLEQRAGTLSRPGGRAPVARVGAGGDADAARG